MANTEPKLPRSTYSFWFKENKLRLKVEYELKTFNEVSRKGIEVWKEVKDRSKWQAKAIGKKTALIHRDVM